MLILPMLLYGAETWVLSQSDVAALGVFERKILRKIFGPVRIGEDYRIRMNHELYELYADMDIVKRITIHRLHELGHVHRQRRKGRPCLRWKDQLLEDLANMGIYDCRRKANN